ncbi:DinB family protein [Clavibacter sp. VKM Ac-2872]|uniref:mycothiol transferase n=1 Tax=Clavibacter sp. VKM Ac-2872 TaxID=2783812 RepID=UPI00188D1472|nr:DinB family protein [Clavibacter sp. VKM Ac-2872]MBF4624448.1 DinB family protein [Clavibacter sp. VKM Ac-2872]
MTPATDLLVDAYGRIAEIVRDAVDGLDADELAFRPDPEANSIGWLVWHLARVQDAQVAHVAGRVQTWSSGGWAARFSLPFEESATGYGQSPEDVGALDGVTAELLVGYLDAVQSATIAYLAGLEDAELDRVVDEGWTPPVTLGARLVSVLSDDLQHAGQASYLAGLLARRR